MAKAILPSSPVSPTAIKGRSDLRDEQVYSACVMSVGAAATGTKKVFTVPQGQAIPYFGSTAPTLAHHQTYTQLTTNLTKAGEFGSGLGDASVRAIGITVEQGGWVDTTGVASAAGAGMGELANFLSTSTFLLRIGGKKQIEGPSWAFPAMGGIQGSLSGYGTNADAEVRVIATNGNPASGGRKLKLPILIARSDTVEGEVAFPGGGSIVPITPYLVWYTLMSLVKGDVR